MKGFLELGFECVEDVRGEGLLVGLEVKETCDSKKLGEAFIEEGLLTKETRSRTFRFAPPLIATPELIDEAASTTSRFALTT